MSRCATWWTILVLLAAFWSAVGFGAKALAAPVTDAPAFLERYGIDAPRVPLEVSEGLNAHAFAYDGIGGEVAGVAGYDRVRILPDLRGTWLAEVVLHEYLHEASFWSWDELVVEPDWLRDYEEGLVQATTEALMPNWWRYLTGKRLRAYVGGSGYDAQARWWKAMARKATGQPWRSRAGREWLLAAVRLEPAARTDLAATTNEGPGAPIEPGARQTH